MHVRTYIHYIALQYIALHYTTLQYITVHTVHYIELPYITYVHTPTYTDTDTTHTHTHCTSLPLYYVVRLVLRKTCVVIIIYILNIMKYLSVFDLDSQA